MGAGAPSAPQQNLGSHSSACSRGGARCSHLPVTLHVMAPFNPAPCPAPSCAHCQVPTQHTCLTQGEDDDPAVAEHAEVLGGPRQCPCLAAGTVVPHLHVEGTNITKCSSCYCLKCEWKSFFFLLLLILSGLSRDLAWPQQYFVQLKT